MTSKEMEELVRLLKEWMEEGDDRGEDSTVDDVLCECQWMLDSNA